MNIFKDKYTAFQRAILGEFMTERQLANLDKAYNKAKIARVRKAARKAEAKFS